MSSRDFSEKYPKSPYIFIPKILLKLKMHKLNWKRIIGAGVLVWIVSFVWTMLTCGWLFNWVYGIEPIIWRTTEQIMGAGTFIGSLLLGLLIALIYVFVYALIYKGIPGKGVKKGLMYGALLWLVAPFSGMITMPLYMTVAITVVVYWILNALVIFLINGAIVGKIYKP